MYEQYQRMALKRTHLDQDEDALEIGRSGLRVLWWADQILDEEKQFSQELRKGRGSRK
jgi:hypothetical protein